MKIQNRNISWCVYMLRCVFTNSLFELLQSINFIYQIFVHTLSICTKLSSSFQVSSLNPV